MLLSLANTKCKPVDQMCVRKIDKIYMQIKIEKRIDVNEMKTLL